jgi:hypothetical protein
MSPVKGAGLKLLIEIETVHRLPNFVKVAKGFSNRDVRRRLQHDLSGIGQHP